MMKWNTEGEQEEKSKRGKEREEDDDDDGDDDATGEETVRGTWGCGRCIAIAASVRKIIKAAR